MDIEYVVNKPGNGENSKQRKVGNALVISFCATIIALVVTFITAIILCDPSHWAADGLASPTPAELVGFTIANTVIPVIGVLSIVSMIACGIYMVYALSAEVAAGKTHNDNKMMLSAAIKEIECAYDVSFDENAKKTFMETLLNESIYAAPEKFGNLWCNVGEDGKIALQAVWEVSGEYKWGEPTRLHVSLYAEDARYHGEYKPLEPMKS